MFAFGLRYTPDSSYTVPSNAAITGFDVSSDSMNGMALYSENSAGHAVPNKCTRSLYNNIPSSYMREMAMKRPIALPKSGFNAGHNSL